VERREKKWEGEGVKYTHNVLLREMVIITKISPGKNCVGGWERTHKIVFGRDVFQL